MARPGAPPATQATPAVRFRGPIEAALASGVAAQDMRLRLTLRDTHRLVRDPGVPVGDISYLGGVMRFLGVQVEQGGVDASLLDVPTP